MTYTAVETPAVAGYTPDKTSVSNTAEAVLNTETGEYSYGPAKSTVTYTADAQKVVVKFSDLTTGEPVVKQTDVTIEGVTDGKVDFTTAQAAVDALVKAGYYVIAGLPTDPVLFDNKDKEDQSFTVTLRHQVANETEPFTATSTVTYEGANPAPATNVVTVTVNHTYQTDKVTGARIPATAKDAYGTDYQPDTYTVAVADAAKVTVDETTGALTYTTIETPAVAGYTPDKTSVSNTANAVLNAETGEYSYGPAESTVTYAADAQKVVVKFNDLTTGQPVAKQTDVTIDGVTDGTVDFKTAQDVVDKLVKAGYYVVAGLPTDPVLFDNKDKEDQSFTVTLRHQVTNEIEPLTATSTVTYEGANPAPATNEVTVTVNHTYQTDKVTGARIQATVKDAYVTDYQPDTYTVAAADVAKVSVNETTGALTYTTIETPAVAGYTPDKTSVSNEAKAVLNTETGEYSYVLVATKVVYTIDAVQKASLRYVNDPRNRDDKLISNGEAYETINFGTTTADLAVPGYSYVIKDAAGNEYKSIDGFVYTAVEADSQDYTVTYKPLPVTVAVRYDYDASKLTNEQRETVSAKVTDGTITGVTDASYATAKGSTTVPAVPGYTFTVTDAAGNKVVEDSENAYDLTQATGTFAVNADGTPKNNQFTVVYTPVKQTVAVDYDTSNLNETQTSQVKAPTTATITGKTDALNATAAGDTTVKAVPGYAFTVTDASGKPVVENSEKNFDLTKVPGQFAVNANGSLKNPGYNVVYTPELQQQTVNVTFPASANRDNETGTVVNKSVTGQDFTVTDLSSYNVDGYTMLVDGTPATSIAVEATDTTANGLNKTDSKPQLHTVTFVANTDQKARLTFVNDPKQRDQITKNDGESDTTINFGTTTADLAVPGYSYVITDAAGKTYKSIDDFVYTAKEADLQDYTVTYTAEPVTVAVHFDTTTLTKEQQATVNATDGEISGKTDADYTTAQGQTTVPAVPGYTFTVTNAAGKVVAQDATSDFDLTTVSGAFTVNPDGTPKNDHFTVVYTPVEQVVTVNTDTTGLNATQKTQVNVPATATITGKTDAFKYNRYGCDDSEGSSRLHVHGDGCDWS
ncbi:mucin-binding protein [Weissella cibaria]|uniref:mucin-binding protein n=1 Tax=Weissella cibaria TaxID=137591 RepID=UPI00223B6CE2|nr:hypothetical protein [Weissella cibaria]MCT0021696.1 hypothetical protein [Weissella cibaria]